ncbi:MAG: inorganic phosphate transporter [Desulfobulbaceae bacterium]|nr:inorganic phosphate transporter [Desulfobulbaceae bacterium]
MDILILALMVLLGLYMAWNIGANDVANSMADAVGSGALSVKQAVIAAGICEFAGAVLVGSHVTDTIRKGIVDPSALASMPGMLEGEPAALMVMACLPPCCLQPSGSISPPGQACPYPPPIRLSVRLPVSVSWQLE